MYLEKILLLDLDPARGLGGRLHKVLQAAFGRGLCMIRNSAAAGEPCGVEGLLQNSVNPLSPNLLFLVLPDCHAQAALPFFRLASVPTIVAMENAEPEEMLRVLEAGAADFITPPFSPLNILPRVWRILDLASRKADFKSSIKQKLGLKHLVGESPVFVSEVKKIPAVAKCDSTVLLLGETGTGKELFARAIHYLGPRSSKPFVPVNCGAIPCELVENELFGHERGAFTSATTPKTGLVAEADGGTLFLDEIDCLPSLAQVKLLRFIQEKEYRPLGSSQARRADLRIIAASNADLQSAIEEGRMRQDLFYRLNIISILLPPLRRRQEDIPLLAERFLAKYGAESGKQLSGITREAIQKLLAYNWPGNVRELEHAIERAIFLAEGPLVRECDIHLQSLAGSSDSSFQEMKARMIDQFEKSYINGLLLAHQGNITKAAQAARKNRRAFFELMRKHNIDGRSFKARA